MGKRNRTDAAIPNDGGSRSKRRKAQEQTPDLDASSDRANSDVDEGKSAAEEVAKQGLKIWHAVKEAVGKEYVHPGYPFGRRCSQFLTIIMSLVATSFLRTSSCCRTSAYTQTTLFS